MGPVMGLLHLGGVRGREKKEIKIEGIATAGTIGNEYRGRQGKVGYVVATVKGREHSLG